LQALLESLAELIRVDRIDPTIHEAEAVCWADDRVRLDLDRIVRRDPAGLGREDVPVADPYRRDAGELSKPSVDQRLSKVAKVNLDLVGHASSIAALPREV
jgi:hypothetical protein